MSTSKIDWWKSDELRSNLSKLTRLPFIYIFFPVCLLRVNFCPIPWGSEIYVSSRFQPIPTVNFSNTRVYSAKTNGSDISGEIHRGLLRLRHYCFPAFTTPSPKHSPGPGDLPTRNLLQSIFIPALDARIFSPKPLTKIVQGATLTRMRNAQLLRL